MRADDKILKVEYFMVILAITCFIPLMERIYLSSWRLYRLLHTMRVLKCIKYYHDNVLFIIHCSMQYLCYNIYILYKILVFS